jgi:hypothetical protein
MNFALSITVGLEISSISKDKLSHVCYCGVEKSQIYLQMNFAMCVTVGLEISGLSVDELRDAGYCVV